MKRVAIIQARMGSTRLPGKVAEQIAGRPMLAHVVRRLSECRLLDEVVVATTSHASDDDVVSIAVAAGARVTRGDEEDVLGRYIQAAAESQADLVVRVTSDCPLIDPGVVDRVVVRLTDGEPVDYVSNAIRRTFPRGLDAEGFFADVLVRLGRLARSRPGREHVTWLITDELPALWKVDHIIDDVDNSDLRWTVDTEDDLRLVRRLYDELALATSTADYRSVIAYVRSRPELQTLNAHVKQKTS